TGPAAFKAGAIDPRVSTLTGTEDSSRYADGVMFHEARAKVTDRYGNPISGVLVSFTVDQVGTVSHVAPSDYVTGADGMVTIHITSSKITGISKVSAKLGSTGDVWIVDDAGKRVLSLPFVPKTADAGNSDFQVSTGPRVADGVQTHTVTVTLRDEYGANAPISDPRSLTAEAKPSGFVSAFTSVNDPAHPSTYVATITSLVAGWKTVTVNLDGMKVDPLELGNDRVEFVAGALATLAYSVSTGTKVANGVEAHTITVTAADAHNNPILTLPGVLSGDAPNSSVSSFAPGATAGQYTATVTSTKADRHQVSVGFTATGQANPMPVAASGNSIAHFIAGPASAATSFLDVTKGSRTVGTPHTATVTVLDAFENPVDNEQVTMWTVSETDPASATGRSDAQGLVTADFTSTVAGTYTVYAVLGGTTMSMSHVKDSGNKDILFVAGAPSASHTTLNGTTEIKLAGNAADPHRAWVDVRDMYGNIVAGPGVSVSFSVSGLIGAQTSPASPVVVDSSGRASVDVTSSLAGTVQVRATVTGAGVTGMQVTKPADHLVQEFATSDVDASKSDYTLTSGSLEANGVAAHSMTVRLRDERGVPVQGSARLISVLFEARGVATGVPVVGEWVEGSAALGSAGNYTAPITSTFADIFDVTVTVGDPIAATAGSPTFVTFHAGVPSTVTSSFEVTSGTKIADGVQAHTVTVVLKDAFGNLVPDQKLNLRGTAAPAIVGSFSDNPAQLGIYTASVTSVKTGRHDVSVELIDAGEMLDSQGANRTAVFVADGPSASQSTLELVTTNPQLVTAGTHTAQVTLRDAKANVIGDQRLRIWSVPAIEMTDGGWVTTNTAGVAQLGFTTSVPGTYTLYAEAVGVQPSGSGVVEAVFVNGPIDTGNSWFTVSQTVGVVADGNPANFQMLTVFLADAAGAGIVGAVETLKDSVSFDPAGPTALSFTEVAGEQGIYEAKITSTKAGSFTVKVTAHQSTAKSIAKLVTGNDIATFIAGEAVASLSILSASPLLLTVGETSTAQVAVVDQYNNPVPGQLVRFWTEAPGPINNGAETSVRSDSTTGIASVPMTTTKAGTYTVHAALVTTNGETTVKNSGNVDVTWVAERTPDWSKTMLTGTDSETRVVGGVEYHAAQVSVRDRFNNP
ncbi:MAG: Ig-like domain-containing protein, partial [Micrococcales bacterium]|nr:Ig-like domain-containing protein [Micrococcales bacterium]